MGKNKAPQKTTGEIGGWTYEITTTFVQVPDEKREAYHSAIRWMAERIMKIMQEENKKNMEEGNEKTTEDQSTFCSSG